MRHESQPTVPACTGRVTQEIAQGRIRHRRSQKEMISGPNVKIQRSKLHRLSLTSESQQDQSMASWTSRQKMSRLRQDRQTVHPEQQGSTPKQRKNCRNEQGQSRSGRRAECTTQMIYAVQIGTDRRGWKGEEATCRDVIVSTVGRWTCDRTSKTHAL